MSKLLYLVNKEDVNGIDRLIKTGCNLDFQDYCGDTALIIACRKNYVNIAVKLIEANCNLNIQNSDGNTALMIACWYNYNTMACKLIEAGCNLDIKNNSGNFAMLNVCGNNNHELIYKLVEAGCKLDQKNNYNGTYKKYLQQDAEPIVEKALESLKFNKTLLGRTVKFIKKKDKLFKKSTLNNLPRDIRRYFIKKGSFFYTS